MTRTLRVLISGAGIAGPALAYWLHRHGHAATIVEKAPGLRAGGQAVDFKGPTHMAVLERMGIRDAVLAARTTGTDMVIVDEDGTPRATIPAAFSSGSVEILRGDLVRVLYERTADTCEYVFGDSITALDDTPDGVHASFEHAAPRAFDLVVGADGIHSRVRRLAFGPEEDFVRHLGYHYALLGDAADGAADAPGGGPERHLMYSSPGRMATFGGTKAPVMFAFAAPPLPRGRDGDGDIAAAKRALADAFAGMGGRVPEALERLRGGEAFELDSISRVEMDHYTRGRAALLGDAGYGNTLGGFGTGLALVGAYVLAGELAAAGGDHRTAFARYDERMRPYAAIARKGNAGPFLAPPTRMRMWMRDLMFNSPLLLRWMMRATDNYATDTDLPDYPDSGPAATGAAGRVEDGAAGAGHAD